MDVRLHLSELVAMRGAVSAIPGLCHWELLLIVETLFPLAPGGVQLSLEQIPNKTAGGHALSS